MRPALGPITPNFAISQPFIDLFDTLIATWKVEETERVPRVAMATARRLAPTARFFFLSVTPMIPGAFHERFPNRLGPLGPIQSQYVTGFLLIPHTPLQQQKN